MKTLVFSHVATWPSHHAESIELSLIHKKLGNEVVYLSCMGALETCPANPFKKELTCRMCRAQTRYTASKVLQDIVETKVLDIEYVDNEFLEFKSVEGLNNFVLYDVPFGSMVYSTLTSELNDSFFDVSKYSKRINSLLKNSIGLYQAGLKIIEQENIGHVYVWNGRRSCDGPLTYAAKAMGVLFSTFISGRKYNSIISRENTHTVQDVPAAKIELNSIISDLENNINQFSIVSDSINYFEFARGRRNNNKLNYVGYYQFSQAFDKTKELSGVDESSKKVIAVFTGTYSEYAGVPGYDDSKYFCKNFYDGVSFLQENIHRIPNAELRIRWHPNSRHLKGNERMKLAAIIERANQLDNVMHILPESNFNTYDLIDVCDVVVGFGTSISVESCLYGKPTIFVGHNMFEDLDCFYKPRSYEEFIELLNSPIAAKNFNHALAWGYYKSNFSNLEYQYLEQRKSNLFYYKKTRIMAPIFIFRRYLGVLHRVYNDIRIFIKNKLAN